MAMFCSQCGAENADSAELCAQCGQPLTARPPAPVAVLVDGPTVFASFWIRVGAALIDSVIIAGSMLLLVFVAALAALMPPLMVLLMALVWIASIVGPWLYTALFESSAMQATPGKKAIGLKVTDLQGNRISFGRATGRHFAEWITGMTFFVGYVMVAFTQKRQSLHDMIAGTVVVACSAEPAQVASAPPAKPMSPWGIAGIFLLAFVPIFGILAAIAIPAYHDFTIRAQVMEGIVIAEDFKEGVTLFVLDNDRWPADLADAALEADAERRVGSARYLESLDISNGTITLTFGKTADERMQRKRLSMRPYVNADGEVLWLCGRAEEPPGAHFDLEDGDKPSDRGITSLPDKHLPAECRAGAIGLEGII
jgi:uncharacterized RDD family membrane protein YckC